MISRTKLDSWCESILESGWLAALVVAPMFFNVFSSRVFEPDKISLVRSIALMMLLAWLVKLANGGLAWRPAYRADNDSAPDDSVTDEKPSLLQGLWQIPFLVPVGLLIIAYIISTLFSVAPFVSWWGSYQRLQGTYSFLSYVIISLLTMAHLRTPQQIRRLQHVIIVTSLPIAIYGVIQHFDIDPLPWGGDVSIRIAGNAGNAIFLAAYLLMAMFFTFERIYSSFAHLLSQDGQTDETGHDMPAALAGGAYLFILMVQFLAVFWTQSRGPLLGILLGIYLFGLLLFGGLRPRGYRAWTIGWIGVGLAGAVFLVLLNTTAVADVVQSVPSLRRLSTLLDLESNTAQVRILIWQGASDMITPHEPLIYPDESTDAINAIRPLVGYGPEAMWVAYNPFYPPRLAHHERRNASPDRSHNETWDSLVITGGLGFLAYMSLFVLIFYWALRWLRLIINRRDSILFTLILSLTSIALIVYFYQFDGSWRFFGVALPAGIMLGLGIYATIAVFLHPDVKPDPVDVPRQLLIIALIATTASHFAEIHFGIAIAATRTYFWVQLALLLTLGMRWAMAPSFAVPLGSAIASDRAVADANVDKSKRRRRSGRDTTSRKGQLELPSLPATVMIDLLIFLTFVFIYTTNGQQLQGAFNVLWGSITTRPEASAVITSRALLFLMLFTWLIASTLGLATEALRHRRAPDIGWWLRGYGLHALVVWVGWLIYGMIQGARLTPGAAGNTLDSQLDHVAGHFALYTWIVVGWLLFAGVVLAWNNLRQRNISWGSRLIVGASTGAILAIITFFVIGNVNIALVRADIIYKQGQQFDSQRNWVSSIELYRRALAARTTEDHYMLFLGRSLLEQAKLAESEAPTIFDDAPTVDDVLNLSAQQISVMGQGELLQGAEAVLKEAQRVNPLNTDHTANLARLYRTWADLSDDATKRQEMLDLSLAQYEMATTLSPNAAHLWNEKGNAHLARSEQVIAEETYTYSHSLDPLYDQTYLLLADFYDRADEYEKIVELLEDGIMAMDESKRHRPTAQMYSYLGVALARLGDLDGAIEANLKVLELQQTNAGAMRNLVILYRDNEQPEEAIEWAEKAITLTNSDNVQQISQYRQLLIDLYRTGGQEEKVAEQYELLRPLAPDDINILRTLRSIYQTQADQQAKLVDVLLGLTQIEPGNYQHSFELAQILFDTGQSAQACDYAQQALASTPADQQAVVSQLVDANNCGS